MRRSHRATLLTFAPCREAALQRGTLTLMHLGYTDYGLFIDAIERGAHFLTRLKGNASPVIVRSTLERANTRSSTV